MDIPACGCVDGKYLSGTDCLDCNWPCKHCKDNADTCTECVGDLDEVWARTSETCYCPAGYYDDGESDNC
jgi:hypothetical protein